MPKHRRYWTEMHTLTQMRGIHSETVCTGEVCVIHNPTGHHMRTWPLHWRTDRGIFERICPHGTGHPDPDHLPRWKALGWEINAVHGCDGCCWGGDL